MSQSKRYLKYKITEILNNEFLFEKNDESLRQKMVCRLNQICKNISNMYDGCNYIIEDVTTDDDIMSNKIRVNIIDADKILYQMVAS